MIRLFPEILCAVCVGGGVMMMCDAGVEWERDTRYNHHYNSDPSHQDEKRQRKR